MTTPITENPDALLYGLEDRPPFLKSVLLAMQHVLAAFGGIIAPPLILGAHLELAQADRTLLVSSALIMAGIATLIQVRGIGPVGARLPCLMGTSFAFLAPSLAVGGQFGLPAVLGAAIAGSLVEIVLSFGVPWLRRFFPDHVTGTSITLIGLTLMPVSMNWINAATASGPATWKNPALAAMVMLIVVVCKAARWPAVNAMAVFIGLAGGLMAAIPLGMVAAVATDHAPLLNLPTPLHWGLEFPIAALIPFVIVYVVCTVEATGSLLAMGAVCRVPVDDRRMSAGLLADGIASLLAGCGNAQPNTTFSQNIGIVALTRVASRSVVMTAAVILILLGIFPRVAALASAVPSPVLGGATLILFGTIAVTGIRMITSSPLDSRQQLTVALSLALGLGVTFKPEVLEHLPESLRMLCDSGIALGTVSALVLNIMLGRPR